MFSDEIQPELVINGVKWDLISAKVVHSQTEKPNFAKIKCVPSLDVEEDELPENLTDLRGKAAQLSCETNLSKARAQISDEKGVPFEEDPLLFVGRVARIYPAGDKSVDLTLFDPGQSLYEQAAGSSPDTDTQEEANSSGGGGNAVTPQATATSSDSTDEKQDQTSLQNKVIDLNESQFTRQVELEDAEGTVTEILAYYAVKYILDEVGITDRNIKGIIKRDGTEYTVGGQTFKGGKNIPLKFANPTGTASELLEKVADRTESTYWFDKTGTFIFGPPDISEHNLQYITETTAGITTPPYQSVKVIGTGVASEKGFSATNQVAENPIIKRVNLTQSDKTTGNFGVEEDPSILREPTYTYKSADLVTDQQVQSTANKLIQKIGEQQKSGEITIVGYPEITLNDVLVMPDSDTQPMGGEQYSATKITHRINNDDGFITKIQVTAPFVNSSLYSAPEQYGQFKPTTLLESDKKETLGLGGTESTSAVEEETTGILENLRESATDGIGLL